MPDGKSVARDFQVVGPGETLIFATDDWVEEQWAALTQNWPRRGDVSEARHVKGTHPSHEWDNQRQKRCRACGGWDNGSYGSQAPCGYDWSHHNLVSALERERALRQSAFTNPSKK